MDPELVDKVRQSLAAINDILTDINDYMIQLRKQTDESIADIERRSLAIQAAYRVATPLMQVPAGTFAATADEPVPDPRRPYIAGRQPRRDGDSFGRQPKSAKGGADGRTEEDDNVPR